MKLRIRGNSLRLRVSRTELLQIAEQGSAEDSIRFAPGAEWRYGIEVHPGGDVAARFAGNSLRVIVPKASVERWLDEREVAIEGEQAIGSGETLRILVEKDYTCLAPRSGEDDSDLFVNPQQPKGAQC
ncbi:MAG: hypothetical protein ABI640_17345 [Gammaproteobacteria bacterium]